MGLESEIDFDDQCNVIFCIENKKFFSKTVYLLNALSIGETKTNEVVLLNADLDNNGFKDAIVLVDPFNIDFNSKKIISLLYNYISKNIINDDTLLESFRNKNSELMTLLFEYIDEMNLNFDYCIDLYPLNYLKMISLKILKSKEFDLRTSLLDYLEILSELLPNCILFLCNIMPYLDEDDLMEICKYKNYKHINILFLENKPIDRDGFKCYVVDDEYTEYML